MRQVRRHPLRAAIVLALALVAGVALTGAGPFGSDGTDRTATTAPPVTTTTTTTTAPVTTTTTTTAPAPEAPRLAVAPAGTLVADATGPTVALHAAPGGPPADLPSLTNPTHEGLAVVFRVLEERGEWLRVSVSARPNGREAWVHRSEVALRHVPNRVVVEVGARRVTVYRGDEVLLQETVAVGADHSPTPLGSFFVDGIVQLTNSGGPYGPYQVSVSGFSEVLHSFGGGVGQIALHGTNRPNLLGQPVSNGCVRLSNEAVTRLAELAPTGTPVQIVA